MNTELSRSNLDLDSFAHAAAHDLKEPLRGIANTATFIVEDAEGMDPVTTRRLECIERLAARMDELLNALLYYSRLGRTELRRSRSSCAGRCCARGGGRSPAARGRRGGGAPRAGRTVPPTR